jgi:cytochrome c553
MRYLTLLLLLFALPHAWAEETKTIRIPPQSLAQWYKPANKRQVWLHTMFRLRREMQALNEYAAEGDAAGVKKWGQRLVDDYRKIPEMVPEWEDEVDLEWTTRLESAIQQADFETVARASKKLGNSCNSCHREYRPLVAALYRTPDYGKLTIDWMDGNSLSFTDAMDQLSQLVNRIKIASEDGRQGKALKAVAQLKRGLDKLGASCEQCHRDPEPKARILGDHTQHTLNELATAIQKGETKTSGKLLGEAAVIACARCHGVHRTLGSLKTFLQPINYKPASED